MFTKDRIYSIKEVADKFQITRNKLRFYENKGLINPRRNESNGFREYSQKDLIDIQLILTYRALDVSIEDIKIVLSNSDGSQIEKQLFKQLKIVNALIGKYRTIQTGLEDTMNGYLKDLSAEDLRENFINYIAR